MKPKTSEKIDLPINQILCGDSLEVLKGFPSESVDCCITSPPYWGLRDYGVSGQLGLETDFREYIKKLCDIFDEVRRVLKPKGTCWVNLGDSYANSREMGTNDNEGNLAGGKTKASKTSVKKNRGTKMGLGVKEKSLVQIPSRFAIEMSDRGWILRNEIIWHKPSCMPSSATDRFTIDFEKVFFFTKQKTYYFETQKEPATSTDNTIRDRDKSRLNNTPGRTRMGGLTKNDYTERIKRTTWSITTQPFTEAHFAIFPEALVATPIKAGCPEKGIVLDPFMGAGTTGLVAKKLGRNYLGIELNPEYIKIAAKRINKILL
jgi:DNA modification methylase